MTTRPNINTKPCVVGVVYKYTSPSGKVYVGQTTNERHRRNTWFCTKRRYAGSAINRARAKYGPENFEYTVLFKHEFDSVEEATRVLDSIEKYYIEKYDSLRNGYNNTTGGLVPDFGIQTQHLERILNAARDKNTAYHRRKAAPHHTKEEIQQLRTETNRKKGRWQKIYQFTTAGVFIREFASAGEAQELGFGSYANIKRACKTLGTYNGYCWRFSEDGYQLKLKPKPKKTQQKKYVKKGYRTRHVVKYDKSGVVIMSYNSIKEAMLDNGIRYCSTISDCLSGKKKTAGGFIWKYN